MPELSIFRKNKTTENRLTRIYNGFAGLTIAPGVANEVILGVATAAAASTPFGVLLLMLGLVGLAGGIYNAKKGVEETEKLLEKMRREFFIVLNLSVEMFDTYGINLADPGENKLVEDFQNANDFFKMQNKEGIEGHLYRFYETFATENKGFTTDRANLIKIIRKFQQFRRDNKNQEYKTLWDAWRQQQNPRDPKSGYAFDNGMNTYFVESQSTAEIDNCFDKDMNMEVELLLAEISKIKKLLEKENQQDALFLENLKEIEKIQKVKTFQEISDILNIHSCFNLTTISYNAAEEGDKKLKLRKNIQTHSKKILDIYEKKKEWDSNKTKLGESGSLFKEGKALDTFLIEHCEEYIIHRGKSISKSKYLLAGIALLGALGSTNYLLATTFIAWGAMSVGTLGVGFIAGGIALAMTVIGMYCYYKLSQNNSQRLHASEELTKLRTRSVSAAARAVDEIAREKRGIATPPSQTRTLSPMDISASSAAVVLQSDEKSFPAPNQQSELSANSGVVAGGLFSASARSPSPTNASMVSSDPTNEEQDQNITFHFDDEEASSTKLKKTA